MTFSAHIPNLNWDQNLPKYWFDNSPFKTHFMNSLSMRFWHGEKFFIDIFKLFENEIQDDHIKHITREFIKQESIHRAVHHKHAQWLESNNYPAFELEEASQHLREKAEKRFSKNHLLMLVVCLEYLTTVFAEHFLKHPELLDEMHPHFKTLFKWHAIEEIEHTEVANDLLEYIGAKKSGLIFFSLLMTTSLLFKILQGTVVLLKKDKQLWKTKTLIDFLKFFFSFKNGIIKNIPSYLKMLYRGPKVDTVLIAGFEK